MVSLGAQLELPRCPHCGVARPSLTQDWYRDTCDYNGNKRGRWKVYLCSRCGSAVLAQASGEGQRVNELYPASTEIDAAIPERPREYLGQALDSLQAPAGAIMLAASAVDAMLKAKGYTSGDLYERIDKAATDHVITKDMAQWAHEVRLDANGQRHADESLPLPEPSHAQRALDFALQLAQVLFVLPSRVEKGLSEGKS